MHGICGQLPDKAWPALLPAHAELPPHLVPIPSTPPLGCGVQSTGEAAADSLSLEPGSVCGWVSTTREILMQLVSRHFPTTKAEPAEGQDQAPGEAAFFSNLWRLALGVHGAGCSKSGGAGC
jgi:hypothetical protein